MGSVGTLAPTLRIYHHYILKVHRAAGYDKKVSVRDLSREFVPDVIVHQEIIKEAPATWIKCLARSRINLVSAGTRGCSALMVCDSIQMICKSSTVN